MDRYIKDRLEEYLSGELTGKELAELEARLERDGDSAAELSQFEANRRLFDAIRVDASELASPAPGFYARVNQLIESEKEVPFWEVFLQPFMVRRLAFAALMWMLVLGSAVVFTDQTTRANTELADLILSEQPPANYQVRMGVDIEQNRASMLAEMMAPRD